MKGVFLTMQASSRTHGATTASPNMFGPSSAWKQFSFETASSLALSPLMDSLELSPGSASQLLPPLPQTPLSTRTALSLESRFLEDWLLDPESLSPAQAQVQGPFMEVPCSQPQNPVGPFCMTPRATPHSQVTSLHSCLLRPAVHAWFD